MSAVGSDAAVTVAITAGEDTPTPSYPRASISLAVRQEDTGARMRRFAEAWLREQGLADEADRVNLIVCEYAQNVYKHTDSPTVWVSLAWRRPQLLITVSDNGHPLPGTSGPWLRDRGLEAPDGRGLRLVYILSNLMWDRANPGAGLSRYALLELAEDA